MNPTGPDGFDLANRTLRRWLCCGFKDHHTSVSSLPVQARFRYFMMARDGSIFV